MIICLSLYDEGGLRQINKINNFTDPLTRLADSRSDTSPTTLCDIGSCNIPYKKHCHMIKAHK